MTTTSKKRRRSIVDLHHREVGGISPRIFAHRAGAAEDLVLRLQIHKKLEKHNGCVNTVSFNTDGDILVSGSDDMMVVLWDWDAAVTKLVFDSGHTDNVFQARFMPFTGDRKMITCGADGQVRHARIREDGNVATEVVGRHEGPAHKMDIEPGSPYIFYSCGEDGLVQRFDLREPAASTTLFTCKPFQDKSGYNPIVSLNAIAVDPRNPNLFVVGGSDEYARVYDIRKYKCDGSSDFGHPIDCFCPPHLIGTDLVTITGLAFSEQSELLVSYCPEFIYLFTREQGLGSNIVSAFDSDREVDTREGSASLSACSPSSDASARSGPQAYKDHINKETVKGVSFVGPNSEYVASGSDCGHIFIWRKKDGELLRAMEGDKYVVNCVVAHPYDATIASSGIENNIKIWTPNSKERARRVDFAELKQRIRAKYSQISMFEYDSADSGPIFDSDESWSYSDDDDNLCGSDGNEDINNDRSHSEDDDSLSASDGNEDINNDGDPLDPCDEDDSDEPLSSANSSRSEG